MLAFQHHGLTGFQTADRHLRTLRLQHLDGAHHGLAVFHHIDRRSARAVNHRRLRHDHGVLHFAQNLLHFDKRTRPELLVLVLEMGLGLDDARCGVDHAVNKLQLAFEHTTVVGQGGGDRGTVFLEPGQRVCDIALGQGEGHRYRADLGDGDQHRFIGFHR